MDAKFFYSKRHARCMNVSQEILDDSDTDSSEDIPSAALDDAQFSEESNSAKRFYSNET